MQWSQLAISFATLKCNSQWASRQRAVSVESLLVGKKLVAHPPNSKRICGVEPDEYVTSRCRFKVSASGLGDNHRTNVTTVGHVIDTHKFGEPPSAASADRELLSKSRTQIGDTEARSRIDIGFVHIDLAGRAILDGGVETRC